MAAWKVRLQLQTSPTFIHYTNPHISRPPKSAKNTKDAVEITKTNLAAKTSPKKAPHKRNPKPRRKLRPRARRTMRRRSQKRMKERSSGDDRRLMVAVRRLPSRRRSRGRESGLVLGRRVRRLRRGDLRRRGKRGRVWVVRSRLLRRSEEVAVEGVTIDGGDERVSRNAQIVSVFCFDY